MLCNGAEDGQIVHMLLLLACCQSVGFSLHTPAHLQAFPWNNPPELREKKAEQRRKQREQQQLATGGGEAPSLQGALPQRPPEPPAAVSAPAAAAAAAGPSLELLCPLCLAPLADDELAPAAFPVEAGPWPSAAGAAARATPPAQQPSSNQLAAGQQQDNCRPVAADGQSQQVEEVPGLPLACCLSCRTQILGAAPGLAGAAQPASSRVSTLLPEVVQRQMQRLALAERRAGGQEGCTASAAGGGRDGGPTGGGVDALRRQIAEYLLDDCEA